MPKNTKMVEIMIVEIISKSTGKKYTIDTMGWEPQGEYMYFSTPNGAKRMKLDDILRVNILKRKLHPVAKVVGGMIGMGAGIGVGLLARKAIFYGMQASSPAGKVLSNILAGAIGIEAQSKLIPIFQDDISNFIDAGIKTYGNLTGPATVADSELEDA